MEQSRSICLKFRRVPLDLGVAILERGSLLVAVVSPECGSIVVPSGGRHVRAARVFMFGRVFPHAGDDTAPQAARRVGNA
jgi:hypothetical protein